MKEDGKEPEPTEAEFVATLPTVLRAPAKRLGVERLFSQFSSDAAVRRLYDEATLWQLWSMWNLVDPRYLALHLHGATGHRTREVLVHLADRLHLRRALPCE